MRGNRRLRVLEICREGSIPACAGEPARPHSSAPWPRVYPRVCGGTRRSCAWPWHRRGLSPRVRGNQATTCLWTAWRGSIPACAGEPGIPVGQPQLTTVYPRVCGGTAAMRGRSRRPAGLSPRVRGNRPVLLYPLRSIRSIPACAGEPIHGVGSQSHAAVYPRVCGGTEWDGLGWQRSEGLSPRVRGNHLVAAYEVHDVGSIPACAGEPGTTC